MRFGWSTLALLFLTVATVQAAEHRELWYFTADEIGTAYRYQRNFGERPAYPLGGQECTFGQAKFLASDRKREFWLSCHFIKQTIRHLTEMLDAGAARYLFSLDADHAHLAVPTALWDAKYRRIPYSEILPAMLQDPATAALYHTAEHLTVIGPKHGKPDRETQAWKEKRNVVGYFDGRPNTILPPHPSGAGVGFPEGYVSFGGFRFSANPGGHLQIFRRKEVITFDITLDFGESADSFLLGATAQKARPRTAATRLGSAEQRSVPCTAIK